jgi:hypothetical protein
MENQTIKFEVTIEEANVILASLARQPYEAVAQLIDKLRSQGSSQVQPPTPQVDGE